jgi:SAM-dependent methyltransferase
MANGADDPDTLAFYATEAPVYAASGRDGASRHLPAFLDRLRPGARILELGCGGGRDAAAMLARGFDVDPTDGTAEMAAKAEARIGRPVRVLRFEEIDPVAAYDAVWAHASLLHAPRRALPGVLGAIHRALRPGGLHFANYKSGDAEGRDRFGRYFNYPSREELAEAYARSAAWEVLATEEGMGGGYDGRQGPWIAMTLRKA